MSPSYSIEPFRGDYENLERMAHASWRDEYGAASFPNFYKPMFLRYLFERIPRDNRDLLIAAYRGDEIVAFLANLPQRFHFQDGDYRAVYSCLLVTGREMLRQGIASALIQEALRVNTKYKFDFSLLTLETGHRSTKMIEKFRSEGQRVEWVKKVRVIARILDLDRVSHSEGLKGWEKAAIRILGSHKPPRAVAGPGLREYRPSDLDACLALLNGYQDKVKLALVWDREMLARELEAPGVVQTLVYETGGRVRGLINFILHDHIARTVERWAWINHLAYPDLTDSERDDFVRSYLGYIRDAGLIGTIEWTRKYYSLKPFYRARFFPYFRAVNLVAWMFNPRLSLKNIPDVYEIQI